MTEQLFLDLKGAAKACGVGTDTIRRAIAQGSLRSKRTGKNADGDAVGKHLIARDALIAWFESLEDA